MSTLFALLARLTTGWVLKRWKGYRVARWAREIPRLTPLKDDSKEGHESRDGGQGEAWSMG